MVITVFGATGKVGSRIVRMALGLGHKVRAFGRNVESLFDEAAENTNLNPVKGYVFDEGDVYAAVHGADAVLSALGGGLDGEDKTRSLGIKNIIAQMKPAGVQRIVNVAGMGTLPDEEHEYIMDRPSYPAEFLAVGREHTQAYLYLKESGLLWTVVCAPDIIDADVDGNYTTTAENLPATGIFKVSAGNIADCMLKELEENRYVQKRAGITDTR